VGYEEGKGICYEEKGGRIMAFFYCPVCNQKFVNERDEREHSKTHNKKVSSQSSQPTGSKAEKPAEPKKEFKIPEFMKRFLHKNISITLINGSTITGKLTGYTNYDLMLDEKLLVPKHGILMLQEATEKI
jgi:sRNA-binding regulator protein Hfq